jgi:hypothetical protein
MINGIKSGKVKYVNGNTSLTGMNILKKIAIRYDIDVNSAVYLSKIIKMFQ